MTRRFRRPTSFIANSQGLIYLFIYSVRNQRCVFSFPRTSSATSQNIFPTPTPESDSGLGGNFEISANERGSHVALQILHKPHMAFLFEPVKGACWRNRRRSFGSRLRGMLGNRALIRRCWIFHRVPEIHRRGRRLAPEFVWSGSPAKALSEPK